MRYGLLIALAACTSTPSGNTITAMWTFQDIATGITTGCPAGFDTTEIDAQEIDATGAPIGADLVTKLSCDAQLGTTGPLAFGVYSVHLSITDGGAGLYATSLANIVDITLADGSIPNQIILNDGGYFHVTWQLVGATTGAALDCAMAGSPGSIQLVSTLAGTQTSFSDDFNCADGDGTTEGLVAGTYTIAVSAVSNDSPLGTPTALTNNILDQNQVTDLGNVTISIDGK